VNVEVILDERDGMFIADCPFLNIVSQGQSEEEVVSNLQEEMQFLFETCNSVDSLAALLDHRTKLRRGESPEGQYITLKRRRVPAEIPVQLLKRFTDAAASFH
jgi:predicted RNase H-like HicB family nuclease